MSHKTPEVTLKEGQEIDIQGNPPSMPPRDEELVTRAQDGEKWATEELVSRYQQKAFSIAYHMCAEDSEEAQDLTQEAFLRAFRSLGKFRGDSKFYTWFYRILVNICLDKRRHRRRWQRVFVPWRPVKAEKNLSKNTPEEQSDMDPGNNPIKVLSRKQLSKDIRKSLKSLPEKQRTVFQLKVLDGMTIREIAEVLGAAEGTVKSHLFRATRFLREELKGWDHP
ncbi:MAG: sigma-70 family RNA polymerase sigma factor [Desulfatiglandaceae bacterium]